MTIQSGTIRYGIAGTSASHSLNVGYDTPTTLIRENTGSIFYDASQDLINPASIILNPTTTVNLYFGKAITETIVGLRLQLSGVRTTGTLVWEYTQDSGANWISIPTVTVITGDADLRAVRNYLDFSGMSAPTTSTVNGVTKMFIRARVTNNYNTSANISWAYLTSDATQGGLLLYDASISGWAEETADSRQSVTTDITFPGSVNSEWYFGLENGANFGGLNLVPSTQGAGNPTINWQYYRGGSTNAWTTFTPTGHNFNAPKFMDSPSRLVWDPKALTEWADVTVNGRTGRWIRAVVAAVYTTIPVGTSVSLARMITLSKTIAIPQTVDRIFTNCFLDVGIYNGGFNHTWEAAHITISTSGGSATTIAMASVNPLAPSSLSLDQQKSYRSFDITAACNTLLTGTSHDVTVDICPLFVSVDYPHNCIQDVDAEIHINFSYNETSSTTVQKTIEIPLNTLNGSLTDGSWTTIDTMPALNLPENGATIKDAYFIFECFPFQQSSGSGSQYTVSFRLDGGAAETSALFLNSTAHGSLVRKIFNIGVSYDHTTTHTFEAMFTDLVAAQRTFYWPNGRLVITYDYTVAGTSSVFISRRVPLGGRVRAIASTLATADTFSREVEITENITTMVRAQTIFHMQQMRYDVANVLSVHIKANGDAGYTNYLTAGVASRKDLAGGMQLVRSLTTEPSTGKTLISLQAYSLLTTNTSATYYMPWASAHLNYIAPVPAAGAGKETRMVTNFIVRGPDVTGTRSAMKAIGDIGTDYYILDSYFIRSNAPTSLPASVAMEISPAVGEDMRVLLGLGNDVASFGYRITASILASLPWLRWPGDVKENNSDTVGRFDASTARDWTIYGDGFTTGQYGGDIYITSAINNDSKTISGSIIGYTGDGSGISVRLIDTTNNRILKTTTSAIGGTFSFTWYESTTSLSVAAQQDSTHFGRSANFTAPSTVTLRLYSGSSYSYASIG